MKRTAWLRLSLPILLALCALGALLLALGGPPVLAQPLAPSTTFTYPGCGPTIQSCISAAHNPGDVVHVNAGTYITNQLIITRAIVLEGAGVNGTKLGAFGGQRVISVGANIAAGVTIQQLRVFGGSLSSGTEGGAGIFAGVGTPLTVLNAEVVSNTITGIPESGAGILVNGPITLTNVRFIANQALNGAGGGLRAVSTANIVGGRFERNVAANSGGGLRATGALTMTNVTVLSNTVTQAAQDGGGVSALGGLLMQGGLVQNNVAADSGGGIVANRAIITGANIISNTANRGGGIFVTGGLNVTNSQVLSNSAMAGDGGGIYASSSVTISIEGTDNSVSRTLISYNDAITNGGGIYAAGNVLLVGAVRVENNNVHRGDGGGIYADDVIDSHGTSFSNTVELGFNIAFGNGGAIRALGRVNLQNSPFLYHNGAGVGNDQGADGGAIYAGGSVFLSQGMSFFNSAFNGGTVYAVGDVFFSAHNTTVSHAQANGGCAYSEKQVTYDSADASICGASQSGGVAYSPLTVTLSGNGFFNLNVATENGGVAAANVVVVRGANIMSNSASFGGAFVATSTLDIANSQIVSNTADSAGGALALTGNAIISNTLFASNKVKNANGIGGAIFARNALTIKRSSFLRNSAGSLGGGAIFYQPALAKTLRVENSLFAGNSVANSVFGAAIAVTNTNTTQLLYNTFANGTTQNSSPAITVFNGTATIVDNIITNHATGVQKIGGTAAEDFNLFFNNLSNTSGGVTSGGSSFTANPLFMSAASDDYHLSPGSPAIDKASNLGLSEDFDGDTRPNGVGFDIGFDEFVLTPISGLSVTSNSPVRVGTSAAFTASISAGALVSYSWNFGDGVVVSSGSSPTINHAYGTFGTFTAMVTATNSVSTQSANTVVTVEPYRTFLPLIVR